MTEQLIDAMQSLTALMEEESDRLSRGGFVPEIGEIANAKIRLTGCIEAELARLKRQSPEWPETLDTDARQALSDASRELRDASTVNADILARKIELSSEMMAAIAAEAQRISGSRSTVYGASGGLGGMDIAAPISINARL